MHSDLVRAALIKASADILTCNSLSGAEVQKEAERYLLIQYQIAQGKLTPKPVPITSK